MADGLVVIVGTSFWDGTPLLEHHMAVELARHRDVLYVEPPISVLTRFRSREVARSARVPGLRRAAPRLTVMSVRLLPFLYRSAMRPVTTRLMRRALRRGVRKLGGPPVSTLVVASTDDVLGCLGEAVSVYYAKDDYVAGAELVALSRRGVQHSVERLCAEADVVVAVSPVLVETLRTLGADPVMIPNGCDVTHFGQAGLPEPKASPCVAFVGHLSNRVDVALLEAVAERGVRLRIIGPTQETLDRGHFEALQGRPNIEWTGPVPYAALPGLLSDVTTGLLPYADTGFNRASFPLKVLEYLAAGRRVVATDLPAVRWLDTDLISVAAGPEGFADAVVASVSMPLSEEELEARRSFAERHSWESRAATFMRLTGLEDASRRAPVVTEEGAAPGTWST